MSNIADDFLNEFVEAVEQDNRQEIGSTLFIFSGTKNTEFAKEALPLLPLIEMLFEDRRATVFGVPNNFAEIRWLAMQAYVNLKWYGEGEYVLLDLLDFTGPLSIHKLGHFEKSANLDRYQFKGSGHRGTALNIYDYLRENNLLPLRSKPVGPRRN